MEPFKSQAEVNVLLLEIVASAPERANPLLERNMKRLFDWYTKRKAAGEGFQTPSGWKFESYAANVLLYAKKVRVFMPNKNTKTETGEPKTVLQLSFSDEQMAELEDFRDLCIQLTGWQPGSYNYWFEIDEWEVVRASNGRWDIKRDFPRLWDESFEAFWKEPADCKRIRYLWVVEYIRKMARGHGEHQRFLLSAKAIGIPTTLESLATVEAGLYWMSDKEEHEKPRHQTNIDERQRDLDIAKMFEERFPEDAANEKKRIAAMFAERMNVKKIKEHYDYWREQDKKGPIHPIDMGRD